MKYTFFSMPFLLLEFHRSVLLLGALAAADKIGSEEQNNHGSPAGCNGHVERELKQMALSNTHLRVLDVGGGKGGVGGLVRRTAPTVQWVCIDVHESKQCRQFDGQSLHGFNNTSYDVVLFNYVLHHAAEHTISLLEEARRVSRRFIIIGEDLKGSTKAERQGNFVHEWSGTFRADIEWRHIFRLLGLELVRAFEVDKRCARDQRLPHHLYITPRMLYILNVSRTHA